MCDPIDGSPPSSPIPGILQARTLEWGAISFSNAWNWSHSVMSDSSRPHGLLPTKHLHPWDFPCKCTGVGCHCFLQICIGKNAYNSGTNIFSRNLNIQSFSKTLKSRQIWAPNGPMIMDMDYFPPLNIYSHPVSNEFINLVPKFVEIFIFVKICIIFISFTYINIYTIFFSETEVAESKKKNSFSY